MPRRNGMAQPFHHAILPLASAADRRTEIRWGLRDFELRFGRRATGMWLPETAVDLATLRLLADEGIGYTILAPWQVDGGPSLDTRRPYRVDLGDGRSMVAALYDGLLSAAVSFEPVATADADAFVRDRLVPRFAEAPLPDGVDPLVVIATDGELYGHHQPFRELFLARLVGSTAPRRPAVREPVARRRADAQRQPADRCRSSAFASGRRGAATTASLRWTRRLRLCRRWRLEGAAAHRLRAARRRASTRSPSRSRDAPGRARPVGGARCLRRRRHRGGDGRGVRGSPGSAPTATAEAAADVPGPHGGPALAAGDVRQSCAWFWESPDRIETRGALRAATRAAGLVDAIGADRPRAQTGRRPA